VILYEHPREATRPEGVLFRVRLRDADVHAHDHDAHIGAGFDERRGPAATCTYGAGPDA